MTLAWYLATIEPAAFGQTVTMGEGPNTVVVFQNSGSLSLEGKCFGNVPSIPTSGVSVLFTNKFALKDGNLFATGSIEQNASNFPDGVLIRNPSSQTIASFTGSGSLHLKGSCSNVGGCTNTVWEPSKWTASANIQNNNNCYNYANDSITGTFAQPGRAHGIDIHSIGITVATVKAAATADGLIWVGSSFPGNTYDCGDGHLVYFAVKPIGTGDYHWWRLDQINGSWSSKNGPDVPLNTYGSGSLILDPSLSAVRGIYTDSGGFFCTCGLLADIN